jgi:succinate dehydrogenase / fumarate reductase cytochrome b subunit
MYDFWMHEMNYKYVEALSINETRYWEELHAKFADLWRVIFYVSFVLLGLHFLTVSSLHSNLLEQDILSI